MRIQALGAALLLSWTAGTLAAEEEKPAPTLTFAMHGFVSGSVYTQDASLGPSEGQQALFTNAQTATLKQPNQDRMILGGDVRQSRFNFSVAGPNLPGFGNAVPRGVLEIDFFGGFGSGNYGDVSLSPRLRLAYAELDWGGGNRIQFGQNLDLIFTIAPASLAHIAFPYSYGAGNIGWRRPGIFGWHTIGDKKGLNFEFAWEVGRSQWTDSGATACTVSGATASGTASPACASGAINGIGQNTVGVGGDPYGFSLGEASGLPAVEARAMLSSGSDWQIFTTGHWQRADRTGVGAGPTTNAIGVSSDIDTVALNAGAKMKAGPLSLAAIGFVGKNLAPLVGQFLQFQGNGFGDVHDKGGWVQAGLNFTKQLSLWGFVGCELPNEAEAITAGFTKLRNITTTGMLQYRDSVKVNNIASDYAIAFEWIHYNTRTRTYSATAPGGFDPTLSGDIGGNQWIVSGNYYF